jgi:hypothetical protein
MYPKNQKKKKNNHIYKLGSCFDEPMGLMFLARATILG